MVASFCAYPRQLQHFPRALQMRQIEHLAVDRQHARAGRASKAATIARARAIASDEGENISLMTGTCAGWIAIFAVNPSRRAARHSARSPASSRKLTNTVSIGVASAPTAPISVRSRARR